MIEVIKRKCKYCQNIFIINHAHQLFCNKECLRKNTKQKNQIIYIKNREKILKYRKALYKKNPEKVKAKNKEWILKNSEKMKIYNKKYNAKEESKKNRRIRNKHKYYNNTNYKLIVNLRTRIKMALKNNVKDGQSIKLLGCSIQHLKKHLEKQFKPGMNWKNYNFKGWHIDHIIPVALFDLSKLEEQKKCFHYTNLQPLWWWENMSKGKKV